MLVDEGAGLAVGSASVIVERWGKVFWGSLGEGEVRNVETELCLGVFVLV